MRSENDETTILKSSCATTPKPSESLTLILTDILIKLRVILRFCLQRLFLCTSHSTKGNFFDNGLAGPKHVAGD